MTMTRRFTIVAAVAAHVLLALAGAASMQAQSGPTPIYRDPTASVDARVRDLLPRLSIDEKFWQLFMIPGSLDDSTHDYSNGAFGLQIRTTAPAGTNAARFNAAKINETQRYFVERTRHGIPLIPFEETLHGVLGEGATAFPQAIALAATWDTTLVGRVAGAIAREARSRGIRQALSPVINIATDQRWGRVEETYGEDPVLTSQTGAAFVAAFQRAGVIATPKHFIANVGEGGRDSYPIEVSRRVLEEIHFPPFRATIGAAGAGSVMTAYNSYDGSPATQNRWLLADVLKRDWGFHGFVISDQAAVGGSTVLHHTEASTATATKNAMESGLDVIFQSSWPQHRAYLAAFRDGSIAMPVIDSAVARVLRAKFELGLFENPYVDVDSAAYWAGHASHRAVALEAARASVVLLRNEANTLPLSRSVRSVAVIGTDATEARLGGYTGPGIKPVSILDGLREKIGRTARVSYAPGPGRITPDHAIVPATALHSLRGEYWDNNSFTGAPRLTRDDANIDFGWTLNSPGRGIPFDWYSVRWTGRITAPTSGVARLGVEGNDGYRLWVDDKLVIDNWRKQSYRTSLATVNLAPRTTHTIRLEYFESTGNARVKLVWDAGVPKDWRAKIDSAVALARRSAVAIVVAGIEEGEFRDRAHLSLPGHQEELIERVAATGTPTVVVIVGGSAVTGGKWLEKADALLDAWYPGEEGGHAVADVLFGDYNPAGRLPMTWPVFEGQLPLVYNHKPTGRGDDYLDLTGQPLFPFGFGLSYTTFEYSDLAISPAAGNAATTFTVRCRVRNSGARAGDEVVQLYTRDVLASVARPIMQLQDFRRVHLAPGESREVSFVLGRDQLGMLDRDMHWVVEPGAFRVLLGASSRDIRLRGEVQVTDR